MLSFNLLCSTFLKLYSLQCLMMCPLWTSPGLCTLFVCYSCSLLLFPFFLSIFIILGKYFKLPFLFWWGLGTINYLFIPPTVCNDLELLGKLMPALFGFIECIHLNTLQVIFLFTHIVILLSFLSHT